MSKYILISDDERKLLVESIRDQGRCVDLSLRSDGHWRQVGERTGSNVFMLGHRETYHDYSF